MTVARDLAEFLTRMTAQDLPPQPSIMRRC
jgi:hypothetical protein